MLKKDLNVGDIVYCYYNKDKIEEVKVIDFFGRYFVKVQGIRFVDEDGKTIKYTGKIYDIDLSSVYKTIEDVSLEIMRQMMKTYKKLDAEILTPADLIEFSIKRGLIKEDSELYEFYISKAEEILHVKFKRWYENV